jgi:hypothetical protein
MDQELLDTRPYGNHDLLKLKSEDSHFQGVSMLQIQNHPILL